MTLDEFFELLKEVAEKRWTIENGLIRTANIPMHWDCPITAVCNKKFSTKYVSIEVEYATKQLQLPYEDSTKILVAADNAVDDELYDTVIRKRLLNTLNLQHWLEE